MATTRTTPTTPATTGQTLAPTNQQPPAAPAAANASERFTGMVMKQFGSTAGAPEVSEYQKRLIQGYFIATDRALKMAEDERIRKNSNNKDHKYDNNLPVTWENVNLYDLALDSVHFARMGLDMMQDNHLFPIPYKNNKTGKYDVTLMPGYNGIQYIAEKYATEKPKAVTIELIHATDTFTPIKKSATNAFDNYEFVINNPFDRGEVLGGFGYIEYEDPAKNHLVIMTRKDIEKRKPKYASANFWGGTQKVWENGKQVEKQEEGWFEEMCEKTLKREVYSAKHLPRDPKKIDDAYQYMKYREAQLAQMEADHEVITYGNTTPIDTTPDFQPIPDPAKLPPVEPPAPPEPTLPEGYNVDSNTGEVTAASAPGPEQKDGQQTLGGPDF